jgi:2,3-bisphosphoglycerate-dependent phosphoglycerate mutase
VPTLILARHGRSTSNTAGTLAGRTPGVALDDTGIGQAQDAAARLAGVPISAAFTSPLERCRQTAKLLLHAHEVKARSDRRLTEVDYGDWSGHRLSELAKKPLWRTVQSQPSAARFPGGESLAEMSSRAVTAVRGLDAGVRDQHGADAIWLAVSHGDVIKAVLADALGLHLDQFQRIVVNPASLSVIRYADEGTAVLTMNSSAGSLDHLRPHRRTSRRGVVGGGK